jgi:hypothetical protein
MTKTVVIELHGGVAYFGAESADLPEGYHIVVRDFDVEHEDGEDHKQDADGYWFWEYEP